MASIEQNKPAAKPTKKTVRSAPVRAGGGVIIGDLPPQQRPASKNLRRTVVRAGGGVIIGNLPR